MLSEDGVNQVFLSNGAGRGKTVDGVDLAGLKAKVCSGAKAATILLISPDAALIDALGEIFSSLREVVAVALDVERGMAAIETFGGGGLSDGSCLTGSAATGAAVVLLDARLPGIGSGQLLASVEESGVHRRCAVALIADEVSDQWIARLREGVIDDIVPRSADAATWRTHISTMQRGHMLSRELEQLREMAALKLEHDQVTGAFNQEAMMSILFRETDRVQRLHGSLSLLMVNIGDFDHWRSEWGEAAGNRLLREVTARTMRLLRSYDVLGRMGEDEFLILLPGCSTINAVSMAERMRMEVFGEPFRVVGGVVAEGVVAERAEGWAPGSEGGAEVQVRLTANFGITASRGRSPVVVMREARETLSQARLEGPESLRCAGELPRAELETAAAGTLYEGAGKVEW